MNFLSPAFSSRSCTSKSGGYKVIAPSQIVGKIEELRVIAKFLEDIDCFQWLRIGASKKRFDFRRRYKKPVQ
jgi:hypothetical protein